MSDDNAEMSPTKPVDNHKWLNNLLGEWGLVSEYHDGTGEAMQSMKGHESVRSLGGLWAFSEGKINMPDGSTGEYFRTLGYDLTFKEYRGCLFMGMSSHLWKYSGELSADEKTMTLLCEGPDMENDGQTTMYRDVHQLINADQRTLTTSGQGENGEWIEFSKSTYTRVK
jgi:hypothetical protein